MTGFKLLKRIFAAMTDDDDQGVTLHRDGPAEDSDSDDEVNLDEMLGYMQHLKQQGVKLGKKKKKKGARAQGDDTAGPSISPVNEVAPATAAQPTPATMTAVAPTVVIAPAAPTVPAPITAGAGTAGVATSAVATPSGPASTEASAVTNHVAVWVPTVALAVEETTANADASAVTASAADNATRGTTAGRVVGSPFGFAIPDLSAAQGTALIGTPRPATPSFNLDRIPRDANGALIIPAVVSHDNHFGRKATEAITYLMLDAPARSMQFYPEWAEFREVVCMKYEATGVSSDVFYYIISNDPSKEALAMRKVSEKRSNVNSDAKLYGRGPGGCVPESKWKILAEENVAPSTSRTPAEWCRFFEHPVYGPGANLHFYPATHRPYANLSFQLALLRGLASKRATTLFVKIPTVGYVCNVVEWPLVNARGRQTPALDTAEAVNRQNVAQKIDQVVAWIAATYNAADVTIWDSRPPAGFNMGPRIKILLPCVTRGCVQETHQLAIPPAIVHSNSTATSNNVTCLPRLLAPGTASHSQHGHLLSTSFDLLRTLAFAWTSLVTLLWMMGVSYLQVKAWFCEKNTVATAELWAMSSSTAHGILHIVHKPMCCFQGMYEAVEVSLGQLLGVHELKEAMEMRMRALGVQLEETRREMRGQVEERERELAAVKEELAAHKDALDNQLSVELAREKEERRREVQNWPCGMEELAASKGWLNVEVEINQSEGHRKTAWELTWMSLESCSGFSAEGIKHLYRLPRLETLYLNCTDVSDSALEGIGSSASIKLLHLWRTKVTDAGLAHLTALFPLKDLNATECRGVTNAGMVHVGRLTGLERLALTSTAVTDDGLQHLTALTKLTTLWRPNGNCIQGEDVRRLIER
ncbi:unnamed protein product [Closterium sp. Yama58-4]|nr:unnamed protein product [Closterium sp. Yama58-4]